MKIWLIGFPGKGGGGDAEGSMSPQSEAFAGKAGNSPGVCPHGTALTSLLQNGISTITRLGRLSCQLHISLERQRRGTQAGGGEGENMRGWEEREVGSRSPSSATTPRRLPEFLLSQGAVQPQGAKAVAAGVGKGTFTKPLKLAQREASCSQRGRPQFVGSER